MKNTKQDRIKKAIIITTMSVVAVLMIALNQGSAADPTSTAPTAPPAAPTPTLPAAPTATPAPTPTPAPTAAATTIEEVLVSDTPTKDSYVMQSKNVIPKTAAKIYATVQLSSAVQGSKVIATLTYKGNNAQIGPVVGKVHTGGDTMEAFAFTNTAMPWPKGEYQIDVSLENGATKSVTFTIGD